MHAPVAPRPAATLAFHPLADVFPLTEGSEFDSLVIDIKKNGLHEKITLYEGKILDGRNRYRACLKIGIDPAIEPFKGNEADARAFVISKNIRRRHLTAQQRRDLFVKLVAAQPEKSDREIAREAKVDHKQISRARKKGEATGATAPVEKRVGADGKARPVKRKRRTSEEIGVERFENGIAFTTTAAESLLSGMAVPQQLSTKNAEEAFEQVKGGEQALRAFADKIKQVHSGGGAAVAPPPESAARDFVVPDEDLALLREFALFVITRARSVSTDPKDHAEWKALRGRVQATLGITP
jgi:hypothetical protein